MNQAAALTTLQHYLQYCTALGITHLPRMKATTRSSPAATRRPLPGGERIGEGNTAVIENVPTLDDIRAEIGDCQRCGLCAGRTKIVFGVGNPRARLMFVGEAPGADEDAQGEPFVGRAGQLLTKIIGAMGLTRSEVYIANIAKCRPPDNRAPTPEEAATCKPFLLQQIAIVRPEIVVCLGSTATRYLLEDDDIKITKVRGIFRDWNGIQLMPTYHPAFLLRNPNMKKPVWEDMQKVMEKLGLRPV